jgi:CBS domain-containing protein
MIKIQDIVNAKGNHVCSIAPGATVREALKLLNAHRIGALMVTAADGVIAGLLSERDILKYLFSADGDIRDTPVQRVMTPREKLLIVTPDDDINYAMNVMTENRVRHLPIIAEGKLAGILSIGDVVKSQMEDTDAENKLLKDYISGKYIA